MSAIVNKVEENSIAQELEIESGDELLSIDEQKITDLIEYNFLCKSEFLTIEIKKKNGEIEEIELEKDFDEDLGIIFESAVFDKIKPCLNKCIFCFVDQQPEGLRETLYIKDDDYRLSYLQGTYVTLTNLTAEDKKRIEALRLGPFYISVHTTNPELRVEMLKNPNAGKILSNLKWLEKCEIPVHLQIVLCPGFNDGEELKRTLNDFKKLKNILSVAIVPVGITKFRENSELKPVTKEIAQETIELADEFNKSVKKQLACCSDEFFGGKWGNYSVPPRKYYGKFSQLEDGVGTIRLLLDDFESRKKDLPKSLNTEKNILFATSQLAKPAIDEIAKSLNKIKNLNVQVIAVKSNYWGDGISVAGLITAEDLIRTVNNQLTVNSSLFTVIIPSVMLRPFTQDFLDGKTLNYVKEKTGKDFIVIDDIYSAKEIVEFINKLNS